MTPNAQTLSPQAAIAVSPDSQPEPVVYWHPAKRLGFRFVLAYLVLYNFPFPIGLDEVPGISYLIGKYNLLWQVMVPWVGKHLLRLSYDVSTVPNGSGDTTFAYLQVLCFLVLALAATLVWSVADRRRTNYQRLYQFLVIYIRFALASSLVSYGLAKLIPPLQMPSPSLSRLMQPYGDSSPMGLLWTFMGASPAYTNFAGLVELVAGVFLFVPRTALVGALLSVIAMTQVFVLNMCYDVPVKLYSFHLLLMSVFLAAPLVRRSVDLLFFNRRVEPFPVIPLFKWEWLNRWQAILEVSLGCVLIGLLVWQSYQLSKMFPQESRQPSLYGIWTVEELTVDGQVKPPLTTDATRWRRAVFDDGNLFAIQLMNDSRERFRADFDTEAHLFTLQKRGQPDWKATFSWQQSEPETLTLAGDFDGQPFQAKLRRTDANQFRLTNRGFHWINEFPFNY